MNNWQSKTGRRYIDGFTSGEVMSQYVVYAGSQQDTDLANYFHINSCAYFHDNGYSGWNSISFGFGSKNNDSSMHVICLFITGYGYSPGYDQLDQTTRTRGMTHEMGHSLHLADDQADNGTMNRCWCNNINTTEANYVNYIYAIAP